MGLRVSSTAEEYDLYFSNTRDFIMVNPSGSQVGSGFVYNGSLNFEVDTEDASGNVTNTCSFVGNE